MSSSISSIKKKQQAMEGEEEEKSCVPSNYWRFTVIIHLAINHNSPSNKDKPLHVMFDGSLLCCDSCLEKE
jgi:hypothetical protein